ncbi:GNAT family N-acetyltransferase [Saprospiraceae bacterium]|nr:GNAT family N-acetyltransferase [bacterium]MDB4768588.1 GNAT family N-acetyltransferase [Saprospiraceae bacterium]
MVNGYLLPQKDISVLIYHSINDVNGDWDAAAPEHNLFLQKKYLQLLENNPPENVHFVYMLYYKRSKPIGVAIGQVGNFSAEKSINENNEPDEKENPSTLSVVTNFIKSFFAKKVDITALVCGNALLTGESHNICFREGEVSVEEEFHILNDTMKFVQRELDKKGVYIALTYLKEYHQRQRPQAQQFLVEKNKFHEFTAQPNMVLYFRDDWKNFEDYLAAMSSKYRVRVKRAFKKGVAIQRKVFDIQDIEDNLDRIYDLYSRIAEGSVFNLVKLNPKYFVALKAKLGADFTMIGYYIEGELTAFFTTIKNYHELEAHFLGYDEAFNREHQMYLNILYDIIKIGFDQKCRSVVFARTALEIKSSVGAEPHEMYWYLRHRNKVSNRFLSQIVDYLNPKDDWVQRRPFKNQA